jgi:uncharacterized membrane protein YdjX (TVP38/TMEM64 family)
LTIIVGIIICLKPSTPKSIISAYNLMRSVRPWFFIFISFLSGVALVFIYVGVAHAIKKPNEMIVPLFIIISYIIGCFLPLIYSTWITKKYDAIEDEIQ